MRINHGRYILTSKEQIEKALKQQGDMAQLRAQALAEMRDWVRAMLNLHQPYSNKGARDGSYVDVSICPPERMKERLGAILTESLWCCECGSSWPCKQIPILREMRDLLPRNGDVDAEILEQIAEATAGITVKDKPGRIVTAL